VSLLWRSIPAQPLKQALKTLRFYMKETTMIRREFLSLLAAATASKVLAASSGKAQVGLSLSEVSTFGATFGDDLQAYKAAGFDAIGLWEYKNPDKASDLQIIASLHEAQLKVATCLPAVFTILPTELPWEVWGPRDPLRRVAMICESIFRFARFDPLSVLVITGPLGDLDPDRAHRIVIDGLREIASAARSAGVRVGLEPIHPMQREKVSFVNSIADAVSLLNHSGLEDIGIMADTYNMWYEDPSDLAAIANRVTGLHVADMPMEIGRTDRVLPGEGGTRSAALASALLDAGWSNGFLDVEIFSTPQLFWGLPVDEAATSAYRAVAKVRTTLT
jgi:sugar phosphate isomerase/epimerase